MTHPKRPRDPNQLAESIIDTAREQKPDRDPANISEQRHRDVLPDAQVRYYWVDLIPNKP